MHAIPYNLRSEIGNDSSKTLLKSDRMALCAKYRPSIGIPIVALLDNLDMMLRLIALRVNLRDIPSALVTGKVVVFCFSMLVLVAKYAANGKKLVHLFKSCKLVDSNCVEYCIYNQTILF